MVFPPFVVVVVIVVVSCPAFFGFGQCWNVSETALVELLELDDADLVSKSVTRNSLFLISAI